MKKTVTFLSRLNRNKQLQKKMLQKISKKSSGDNQTPVVLQCVGITLVRRLFRVILQKHVNSLNLKWQEEQLTRTVDIPLENFIIQQQDFE